jgi:hypothetical protein
LTVTTLSFAIVISTPAGIEMGALPILDIIINNPKLYLFAEGVNPSGEKKERT